MFLSMIKTPLGHSNSLAPPAPQQYHLSTNRLPGGKLNRLHHGKRQEYNRQEEIYTLCEPKVRCLTCRTQGLYTGVTDHGSRGWATSL